MDHEPLAGDPGTERELELANGRDIGAEPLLGEEAQDRHRRERLRPVGDERLGRRRAIGPRLRPQGLLVVDDERRAELAHEVAGPRPTDHELARLDCRRVGHQVVEDCRGGWLHESGMVTLKPVNLLLT